MKNKKIPYNFIVFYRSLNDYIWYTTSDEQGRKYIMQYDKFMVFLKDNFENIINMKVLQYDIDTFQTVMLYKDGENYIHKTVNDTVKDVDFKTLADFNKDLTEKKDKDIMSLGNLRDTFNKGFKDLKKGK